MEKKHYYQYNHLIQKDVATFKNWLAKLIEKNKDNHRSKYYEILFWICDCTEDMECVTQEALWNSCIEDEGDLYVNPLFETLEWISESEVYDPENLGKLNYFIIKFGDVANRRPKGFEGHIYLDEDLIAEIKNTCPKHFIQYVGKNGFWCWRRGNAGSNDFEIIKETKRSITLKIFDPAGLHFRPCNKIIGCFYDLKVNVTAVNKNKEVNAKSIIGLFSLVALKNEQITFKVTGRDAAKAIENLKEIRI